MKKNTCIVVALFLCFCGSSCQNEVFTTNSQLIAEFEKYTSYIDTSKLFSPDDSPYVYLYVKNRNQDTINVILSLSAGAYGIIYSSEPIVSFFDYKKHMVMLVGDYPNNLINTNQCFNEDIKKKVLTEYFSKEYEQYLKEPFSLKPKMADPMTMSLIFKKDGTMISAEKVFH